jgi:hypothetical protein
MLILPASRTRKRLDIPHEPGQWVEIRRLSWSELPSPNLRMVNVNDFIAALFKASVAAWSYDVAPSAEIVREDGSKASATACLDDPTSDWLLREINALNSHAEREHDEGNATAPSISS